MADLYSAPATKARAVDIAAADHDVYCRALYVGGAGTVVGILLEDTAPVTFTAVAAGTTLPFSFKTIVKVGTTATLMVAGY